MRIIAGQLKGKRLKAPRGFDTRPVTDRIKENLFNIWQMDIVGAKFLDLFAGSGSMGIEAVSRGAAEVVMVDQSFQAVKTIEANLKSCGVFPQVQILNMEVLQAIDYLEKAGKGFNIVFIDPPFKLPNLAERVLGRLSGSRLGIEGQIIARVRSDHKLPNNFGGLAQYRLIKYGESSIYCFGFKEGGIMV